MDEWDRQVEGAPPNLASRLRPLRRQVLRLKARFPSSFDEASRGRISRQTVVDAERLEMASQFIQMQADYTCKWLAANRCVVFVSTELFWYLSDEITTADAARITIGPWQAVRAPPGTAYMFLRKAEGRPLLMAPLSDMFFMNKNGYERSLCMCEKCESIRPLSKSLVCSNCHLVCYCCVECQAADASHADRCAYEHESARSIIENVRARSSYPFVNAFYFSNGDIRLVQIPLMAALQTPLILTNLSDAACEEATSTLALNAPFVQRLALRVLISDSLSETRYTPTRYKASAKSRGRRV